MPMTCPFVFLSRSFLSGNGGWTHCRLLGVFCGKGRIERARGYSRKMVLLSLAFLWLFNELCVERLKNSKGGSQTSLSSGRFTQRTLLQGAWSEKFLLHLI